MADIFSALQAAAGYYATPSTESGWNNWQGSWARISLSSYSAPTNYGNTFGGAYDIAFSPDGLTAYTCGQKNATPTYHVAQYSLATPYVLTGATFVAGIDPGTGSYVTNIHFSPDGTKLIFADWDQNRMGSVDLSTAWDISSAGSSTYSTTVVPSGNLGSTFLTPDGLKLFVTNRIPTVYEYSMSSAGDISTLTSVGSTTIGSTNWYGIYFSGDGRSLYLGTRFLDTVELYALSSEYDISPATFLESLSVTPTDTYGVRLVELGQYMWIGQGSGVNGDFLRLSA